jgi:sec-independent protein translocase protein TatA
MPFRIGAPELIIILIIVILVFGVGRISKLGGELGGAIRSFRKGINGNDSDNEKEKEDKS